ncbi:MAG: Exonuclease large subunit, partial [Bacteroidota bacterium]
SIQKLLPIRIQEKTKSINSLQLTTTASAQGRLSAAKSDLQSLQVNLQTDALGLIRQAQTDAQQCWKDISKSIPKNVQLQNTGIAQYWKTIVKQGAEKVTREELAVKNMTQFVEAHSPQKWLNRGFGILKQKGKTISSLTQLHADTPLVIQMKDGQITTQIQDIQND